MISERSDPPVFVAGKSPPFLDDFSIATFDPGKWNGVPWFWRWRFPQLFRPNGRNKSVERGMMGLLVGGDWNMFYDFPETVGKFVVPNCYSAHHFSGRAKNHQPDICIYISHYSPIKPYQTTMENTPFHHSTEKSPWLVFLQRSSYWISTTALVGSWWISWCFPGFFGMFLWMF